MNRICKVLSTYLWRWSNPPHLKRYNYLLKISNMIGTISIAQSSLGFLLASDLSGSFQQATEISVLVHHVCIDSLEISNSSTWQFFEPGCGVDFPGHGKETSLSQVVSVDPSTTTWTMPANGSSVSDMIAGIDRFGFDGASQILSAVDEEHIKHE